MLVTVDDRYGLHETVRAWVDDAERWQRVRTMPGLYSPVEAVRRGDAELALTTAVDTRDAVTFTPLGTAELQIRINPSRADKQGVTRLQAAAEGSLTDTA